MCTIFHEFVHAHIRALFSQIYPFDSITTKDVLDKAYENYKKRSLKNRTANNLFEFIQISILSVISDLVDLRKSDIVTKYLPKDEIKQSIRKWHHSLNEIVAHILDYSYFYDYGNEIYVKGIWTSWLKLPFIYSRIPEYLLRTICAVASNEKGKEDRIFDKSVRLVKTYLTQLLDADYMNKQLLEEVIDRLDNTADIQKQFFFLYPFIYIVKNFLISSQIKESVTDPLASLQDDDSYSLELKPGVFDEREIRSPITFLQDYLKDCFSKNDYKEDIEEFEFLSLWIYLVMSSSLYQNERGPK